MRSLLIVLSVFVFFIACTSENSLKPLSRINSSDAKQSIEKVLYDQQASWNKGDIDAFMKGYWNSPQLTFIGRSGVNKGWQTTLENYKKGYPDKETMGSLSFEVVQLDSLSNEVYRMIGKYTLERKEDKPSGIFTLIWQFKNGQWLITSDQTCG